MDFLRRFGFYLIGVAIGSIAVIFIWKAKETSFEYGPDARTLKQIRIRKRVYSDEVMSKMSEKKIDTATITNILRTGDVDFGKSKPRLEECPEYYITSDSIDLYIIRCETTATVQNIYFK